MPSSFGCSPGTYGDRLWTTELQKRLMICDPATDHIKVGHAKLWEKSALHAALIHGEGSAPDSEAEVPDSLSGRWLIFAKSYELTHNLLEVNGAPLAGSNSTSLGFN